MQGLNYINQLYFTVLEQDNPAFMLLYDHSIYSEELPSTPVYDIVPPGHDKAVRINAKAGGITNVNSALLFPGLTADLPKLGVIADGIYIITYKIQPYDTFYVTKNELRTVMLERDLDLAYILVDKQCRHASYRKWKEDLLDLQIMLMTAKALIRLNNISQGADVFREVQKEAARIGRLSQRLTV